MDQAEFADETPKRRRARQTGGGSRAGRARRSAVGQDNFYASLLTAAELAEVAAAGDHGLDDEVTLLRVLARRAVADGNPRQALTIVRALVTTLKAQQGLSGGEAKRLDRALATVLEELGRQDEPPL